MSKKSHNSLLVVQAWLEGRSHGVLEGCHKADLASDRHPHGVHEFDLVTVRSFRFPAPRVGALTA